MSVFGAVHPWDVRWRTHPKVENAMVQFTKALYEIEIFQHEQHGVEALFQKLCTWSDVKALFVNLMGLAAARAEAHSNSNELCAELERARDTLELRFKFLQKVGAEVQDCLESHADQDAPAASVAVANRA